MRILYATTSYPPVIGGAQIHLHCLAKAMECIGNEVRVVTHWSTFRNDWLWGTTVFSGSMKEYEYEGVSVFQIGFPLMTRITMFPWTLMYYFLMSQSVQRLSSYMMPFLKQVAGAPSLVHATRIGREFITRASLDFARKRGIPFVLTPNHHPRWRGYVYQEYDKIYREADAIFALTSAEKEALVFEKGVAEEKIYITGIGPVLSDRYSEKEFRVRYDLKERFVLYLGQQYKYKGINAILQAAPIVWQKHPEIRFVFIGPHTQDSCKAFKKVCDPRIVNLGSVDLETKTSAIAACEFLCLPSLQESFGGVFVEAWSFRKAVIGGRISPIACVIDHGRDGLLSSQDPYELAEAISHLLSDSDLCRAMGNAGWQKVQNKYAWDCLAKKTLDVYRDLSS